MDPLEATSDEEQGNDDPDTDHTDMVDSDDSDEQSESSNEMPDLEDIDGNVYNQVRENRLIQNRPPLTDNENDSPDESVKKDSSDDEEMPSKLVIVDSSSESENDEAHHIYYMKMVKKFNDTGMDKAMGNLGTIRGEPSKKAEDVDEKNHHEGESETVMEAKREEPNQPNLYEALESPESGSDEENELYYFNIIEKLKEIEARNKA